MQKGRIRKEGRREKTGRKKVKRRTNRAAQLLQNVLHCYKRREKSRWRWRTWVSWKPAVGCTHLLFFVKLRRSPYRMLHCLLHILLSTDGSLLRHDGRIQHPAEDGQEANGRAGEVLGEGATVRVSRGLMFLSPSFSNCYCCSSGNLSSPRW